MEATFHKRDYHRLHRLSRANTEMGEVPKWEKREVGKRQSWEGGREENGRTARREKRHSAVLGQQRTGYYFIFNRNIRAYSLCSCYRCYRTVYCRPFSPVDGPEEKQRRRMWSKTWWRGEFKMLTRPVESWHCINPECAAKPTIRVDFNLENSPPRCLCGTPMKKEYRSPVFRYLDFLRVEAAVEVEDAAEAAER